MSQQCLLALSPWRERSYLPGSIPMGSVPFRRETVTDASLSGWGVVWQKMTGAVVCSEPHRAHQCARAASCAPSSQALPVPLETSTGGVATSSRGGAHLGSLRPGISGSLCLGDVDPLSLLVLLEGEDQPPGSGHPAHTWPEGLLYAIPPLPLILTTLLRVFRQDHRLTRSKHSFAESFNGRSSDCVLRSPTHTL